MAVEALNLDPNVWYYIQSFGTDFYLDAGSGSTSMALGEDSTSDKALWQYGTVQGSSTGFLRSKADKTCFVPVISSQNQDTIPTQREPCSNSSLTWSVANWNGQNVAEGLFFSTDDLPGTYYVFAQLEGQVPVMQRQSTGNQSSDDVYYQWAFSSVSQINDQSFSTLFESSSSTITTTESAPNATTITTAEQTTSSSTDSSTASIPSVETILTTVTDVSPTSTDFQSTGPSTLTVVVTPSRTSRAAPTATGGEGVNAAGQVTVGKSLALAIVFCALCVPNLL